MATRCKALFYISFSSLCCFWIAAVAPCGIFCCKILFTLSTYTLIYGHHCYRSSQQASNERLYVLLNLIQHSPFWLPRITSLFWALHSTDFIHHYLWVFFSVIVFCGKFCQDGLCGYDIIFFILLLTLNMDLL